MPSPFLHPRERVWGIVFIQRVIMECMTCSIMCAWQSLIKYFWSLRGARMAAYYYVKYRACAQGLTRDWFRSHGHVATWLLVTLWWSAKITMQDKCLGCSCETSGFRSRRLLTHVRSAWHDILIESLPEESTGYQIDCTDPEKAYLCPTCFSYYERYSKLKASLNSIQSTLTAKIQDVINTGMVSACQVETDSCSSNSTSELGKRPEHDHHDSASTCSISNKRSWMIPRQLNFSLVDSTPHSPTVVVSDQ